VLDRIIGTPVNAVLRCIQGKKSQEARHKKEQISALYNANMAIPPAKRPTTDPEPTLPAALTVCRTIPLDVVLVGTYVVPKPPVAVKIPVALIWTGVVLTPAAGVVAGAGARPTDTVEPATGVAVVNCTCGTVTAVESTVTVLDEGMGYPAETPVLYVQGTV
jgi:hypothetical protein